MIASPYVRRTARALGATALFVILAAGPSYAAGTTTTSGGTTSTTACLPAQDRTLAALAISPSSVQPGESVAVSGDGFVGTALGVVDGCPGYPLLNGPEHISLVLNGTTTSLGDVSVHGGKVSQAVIIPVSVAEVGHGYVESDPGINFARAALTIVAPTTTAPSSVPASPSLTG
jgi:hypothetical protein